MGEDIKATDGVKFFDENLVTNSHDDDKTSYKDKYAKDHA